MRKWGSHTHCPFPTPTEDWASEGLLVLAHFLQSRQTRPVYISLSPFRGRHHQPSKLLRQPPQHCQLPHLVFPAFSPSGVTSEISLQWLHGTLDTRQLLRKQSSLRERERRGEVLDRGVPGWPPPECWDERLVRLYPACFEFSVHFSFLPSSTSTLGLEWLLSDPHLALRSPTVFTSQERLPCPLRLSCSVQSLSVCSLRPGALLCSP